MRKYLGKTERSPRGFKYIEFRDIYNVQCSIQQSSLAGEDSLWLGREGEAFDIVTRKPIGTRMHINRVLAKQIVNTLNKWLNTGEL